MKSMDDNAVSPVVGVILMVAITVVLSAGLFVMVQSFRDTVGETPTVAFQKDTSGTGGEVLVLVVGPTPIDAADIRLSPADCVLRGTDGNLKTSGNLAAGDYVDCASDGDVIIADDGSGTLLFSGSV